MNYFTKELWEKSNSPDEAMRAAAEYEWQKRDAEYSRHFESVKKHLPPKFLSSYLERGGLHDYIFEEISLDYEGSRRMCRLGLSDGDEKIFLVMEDVSSIKVDVPTFQNCVMGKLSWGYDEFDLSAEGRIKLSLLCDMTNEMEFEFRKIQIQK